MNLYGQDMSTVVTPLESGLAWTVDLKSARDQRAQSRLIPRRIKKITQDHCDSCLPRLHGTPSQNRVKVRRTLRPELAQVPKILNR